jgi:hypothetical protein
LTRSATTWFSGARPPTPLTGGSARPR